MDKYDDDLDVLRAKEAELERQLMELKKRRTELEVRSKPQGRKGGRPLRDITLDLLQDAKCPLNSLLLASVIRSLYGRVIPSTRFGTMSNDEANSFDSSRSRPVYLCHCLTFDQGHAVKRYWARSDWPLAERIMGPMSSRILFLRAAAWTIEVAHRVEEGKLSADNLETLKYVAADQARDAGLLVSRGEFPYAGWLSDIADAIDRHAAEDRALREATATELMTRLSLREQLYGSREGLVSLPGTRTTWRSAIGDNS